MPDLQLESMLGELAPVLEVVARARERGLLDGVAVVESDLNDLVRAATPEPTLARFEQSMDQRSYAAGGADIAKQWGQQWLATTVLISKLLDRIEAVEGVHPLTVLTEISESFPEIWTDVQ